MTPFTDDDSLRSAFTDADLKRFKELARQQQEETVIDTDSAIWVYANLSALLARLEAAEAVCNRAGRVGGDGTITKYFFDLQKKLEAWRKAAGK